MKISIITISHNSKNTIQETINSILKQNFDDFEYIIIDSLSNDGTINIIKEYENEKIRFVFEKDKGISDAFNKGISMSTGEIIGIINSDDVLFPGTLDQVEKNFVNDRELDVLYGNIIRFKQNISDGYEVKPDTNLEKLKYAFLLHHPAIFIRKKAYEKYGMYSCDYKNAMDYELIARMYFNGAKFKYVNKVLSCFREGGISQSNFKRTVNEHITIAKKYNHGFSVMLYLYIAKIFFRKYILLILNSLGIEKKIRKMFKNQKYYNEL